MQMILAADICLSDKWDDRCLQGNGLSSEEEQKHRLQVETFGDVAVVEVFADILLRGCAA